MGVQAQGGAHLLLGSGRRGELQRQKWGKCSKSLDHLESWEVEKELRSGMSQTLNGSAQDLSLRSFRKLRNQGGTGGD